MTKPFTLLLLPLLALRLSSLHAQCSSLYTTPEFPVATHPSDGNTQSWGCNLFTPTQFGVVPAPLTGLQIYVDNSFGPTTYASQTIWMRHTAISSYPSANYPGTAGFTQCFSGTYSFPMSGLYTVNFNVSNFNYDGVQNVEILFENRSNVYRANEPWFRRTLSYGAGVYRSRWNGNFGFGGFPGSGSDGSAVRLTYTLSLTAVGGGGCGTILPVSLLRFVGEFRGPAAHLEWESAGESGPGSYALERSADGEIFDQVAFMNFRLPYGQPQQYTFDDSQAGEGAAFYRIVRVDIDGSREPSQVIVLRRQRAEEGQLWLWPNPAAGQVRVVLPWPAEEDDALQLLSPDGKVVSALTLEAGKDWTSIQLEGLPQGLYLIRYLADGKAWTGKVMHAGN